MIIKTLTPYYLDIPWLSPLTGVQATKIEISLYVWSGDKNTPPTEAQHNLSKLNIGLSIGNSEINIAGLVNDSIKFIPTTVIGLNATNSQRWVKSEVYYITTDPADEGVAQLIETNLAVKGYAYGMDGRNGQPPTTGTFIEGREFKVNSDTIFSIPIELGDTDRGNVLVNSYPNGNINLTYATGTTNESSETVKILNIDISEVGTDELIEVNYNAQVFSLFVTEEHRYEPINVFFLNKEGEQQTVTFFKERKDTLEIERETYENDMGQPADGVHQYVDYNIQARHSFTANSGFIYPEAQESFRQLILSSRVYTNENNVLTPVNISKSSIEYKTRVNYKLINYTFDFKYSYNEINSI